MHKGRNVFGGLFLVFLGALFLLINFGYLGWDIWLVFLEFWPLILIALGIRLIFRHNMVVQILVFLLIFVFPFVYYLGFGSGTNIRYFPHWFRSDNYSTYNWAEDNDGRSQEGRISLEIGAGSLIMGGTDKFAEVNAEGAVRKPSVKVDRSGTKAEITVKQHSIIDRMPMIGKKSFTEEWRIGINRDIVWDLNLSTGAIKGEFNLQDIKFKKLDIDTGAGSLRFVFGDTGMTSDVDIDAGAGNITLVFPEKIGVRARLSTGLGNKNFTGPAAWEKDGETYTTGNYGEAPTKINIIVDHGAGNVNIISE